MRPNTRSNLRSTENSKSMKNALYLAVMALFLVCGCYNVEPPKKPDNLLSEDQMVNVIVDMAIMSAAKGVNKKKIEVSGIVPAQYIYDRNTIDSLSFAESNVYYAFDVETYKRIYTRVKDTLNKKREFYKNIEDTEKVEKPRLDTIKRNIVNKFRGSINDSIIIATDLQPKS